MAGFSGLSFTVVPVLTGAGALNTAGVTLGTTMIAGILDPQNTQKLYNPVAEGNSVTSGDNATKWLPVLQNMTAAQVQDNWWQTIPGQSAGATKTGQITLTLTPAAANTVEAASPQSVKVSPDALLIVATGSF